MKEEKNTVEETKSKPTGKIFLGKSKNGPRDDNHLMSTLDQASLKKVCCLMR